MFCINMTVLEIWVNRNKQTDWYYLNRCKLVVNNIISDTIWSSLLFICSFQLSQGCPWTLPQPRKSRLPWRQWNPAYGMQLISVDAAKKNKKPMKVQEAGLNRNVLEQFVAFGLNEHIGAWTTWLIVCQMYYCNKWKVLYFSLKFHLGVKLAIN